MGGAGYSSAKFTKGKIAVHFTAVLPSRCQSALAAANCSVPPSRGGGMGTSAAESCTACGLKATAASKDITFHCCQDCNVHANGWTAQPDVLAATVGGACRSWDWPGAIRTTGASIVASLDPALVIGEKQ